MAAPWIYNASKIIVDKSNNTLLLVTEWSPISRAILSFQTHLRNTYASGAYVVKIIPEDSKEIIYKGYMEGRFDFSKYD